MNATRAVLFIFLCVFAHSACGYGPTGHEIVGGTADKLLANTAAGRQVNSLIDGISLEKAAVIPDEIKAWDKDGVDDPNAFPNYSEHGKIDKQLREFWRANQPTHDPASPMPSHHWFHYTDVPVLNAQKYSEGKTGRSQWDIVHMIAYCVSVLRGEAPENNARKITKPVAVILLAHYVGDIHQPLHVGAEYFDQAGRAVDPDKGQAGIEDEGGNTIMLRLNRGAPEMLAKRGLKLHGFWDNEAVMANLPSVFRTISKEARYQALDKAKRQLIDQFAREQAAGWRLPANVALKSYGEAWADEILPIAREAHERLRFVNVHPQLEEDRTVAAGNAYEKNPPDHVAYADWVTRIVREELHKAGWRLADLLSQAVTSIPLGASSAPVAAPTVPAPSPAESIPATPAPPPTTPPTATDSKSQFGEYPANYKEIVTAWMKANGLDVSRIEWQGDPKPADAPGRTGQHLLGYLVIFNTPEQAASKTRSILIRDGVVINSSGF